MFLTILSIRAVVHIVSQTTRVVLSRGLLAHRVALAILVAAARVICTFHRLPAIELLARREAWRAFVVGTETARALRVVIVAKFSVGAIRFAVRPAAPVVLANDNVAEAALAPRSFVTPGLVPRALRLVHAQTRITLL